MYLAQNRRGKLLKEKWSDLHFEEEKQSEHVKTLQELEELAKDAVGEECSDFFI